MRRLVVVAGIAGVALGVASEAMAFEWDEPQRWVPDLTVGLVFIGAGLGSFRAERAVGALLAMTGSLWFLGNLVPAGLYLYLGTLAHLLITYPGWRPRSGLAWIGVAAGYAAAVWTPAWSEEGASIAIAAGLAAVVAREQATAPSRRRYRRAALGAALGFSAVVVAGAVARMAIPGLTTTRITLLAYQAALCGVALVLMAGARRPTPTAVTDLVIELGEGTPGSLRDSLATAVGDPTLELGYWTPSLGRYVDVTGQEIVISEVGGERRVTEIRREGRPFAVLVHDHSVLQGSTLVDAVGAAIRLTASNADLQARVREQVQEVVASRRRLVVAADTEQRHLEDRLRRGAERRLAHVDEVLRTALDDSMSGEAPHLERAGTLLEQALGELRELGHGLHPRELADGLPAALAALAERGPVPVRLSVAPERFQPEIEVAVYYTCAEALANVAKHASATEVSIDVGRRDDRVTAVIADDGVGGADVGRGTGLEGLIDRVEAVGGRFTIESNPGAGTRLTADIPIGG